MAKKTKAARPVTNTLLTSAGIVLDTACANEILGRVLFEGEDGKFYTITVEAVIGEASRLFVEDILQEIERENDAPKNEPM